MKNNPVISVIIPIYGVEKYIEKCLRSLLEQTYEDFEVILVDDGSIDNSIGIARALVGHDSRFIFLEKENGGQGSARNLGIDYAKGGYLAFLDSDDYVAPIFLEKMYYQLINEQVDICLCDVNIIENNKVSKILYNNVDDYFQKNDFLLCLNTISSFMCDKLFKKSVFDGMRFDENLRTYEDSHLVFRLIYGKKLTQVGEALYNYVQRPGSTTNSLGKTYIFDKKQVMQRYIDFAKSHNLFLQYENYIVTCYLREYLYLTAVGVARYSQNYLNDTKDLKNDLDRSYYNTISIMRLCGEDKKRGFGLVIFKFSPVLFRFFIKGRDSLVRIKRLVKINEVKNDS